MRAQLLTIWFCGFLLTVSYCQNTFQTKFSNTEEEIPMSIEQVGNSYFLAMREGTVQFSTWHNALLLKLNTTGELQNELQFNAPDSSYYDIMRIQPIDESEFLIIGGIKEKEVPFSKLWMMKLDTSLNIIWERKYITNRPLTSSICFTKNPNGNFLIGTSLTTGKPNWINSLLFIETNANGDSLQSHYFYDGNPMTSDIQSLIYMGGQYKAFVRGYQTYTGYNCLRQILQLDSALNLIEVRPVPYTISNYMCAISVSENEYLISGMFHSPSLKFDVCIAKLDSSEDSLAFNKSGSPGAIEDYSGWITTMAFNNSNCIYVGGTCNYSTGFYCTSNTEGLMVSNYDSLLNCRWTRFFGSDACYTLTTLGATSDGGCLLAGVYNDSNNPSNLLDAIILKIDSSGVITGQPERAKALSHQAILYPNPGKDFIKIKSGPQLMGSSFSLFDESGCKVMGSIIYDNLVDIDVTFLSCGMYTWNIDMKNKTLESGKWIKL